MNFEIVSTLLASLGGASIIITAFAHFLGKVWAGRIAQQTIAKYAQELEIVKSKNTLVLEEFKKKSESELKEREQFTGISLEIYQDFFKNRVSCYIKLLELKNRYISDMHEDIGIEETESWGDAYYSTYKTLRSFLIENQLYISNELEKSFHELRIEAATYTKEADLVEVYALSFGTEPVHAHEQRHSTHDKFAKKTHELMSKVMKQIDSDVKKLRSRIEIDRP